MRSYALLFLVLLLITGCVKDLKNGEGTLARIDVRMDSINRACYLHCPAQAPSGRASLFIVLHGAGGAPRGLIKITKFRFNELSDMHGFYVAYPEGVERTWNDTRDDPSTYAHRVNIDDVGFISLLIDQLINAYPVDGNKVYITGFSNGGFMAYRLACELSSKISGIAVVAATNPVHHAEICRPERPVDIIIFNGTDDPIVPYHGGELRLLGRNRGRISSTDETVRYWKDVNGCTGAPEIRDLPDIDPRDGALVREISYARCRGGARVRLYRITGGGHTWPGGSQYFSERFIGNASRDINACDIIYEFFCENKYSTLKK